jgi:hypothetical protein
MCVINRVSGDPPVRLEVAKWSVRICPFLSRPGARRDKRFEVDETGVMAGQRGVALARNPGVSAIYLTGGYTVDRGVLHLGVPTGPVTWWAEGREATPAEVWASVEGGLPRLIEEAAKEGPEALAALDRYLARALPLFPVKPAEAA